MIVKGVPNANGSIFNLCGIPDKLQEDSGPEIHICSRYMIALTKITARRCQKIIWPKESAYMHLKIGKNTIYAQTAGL